jgi:hypothetical protein
MVAAANIVAKAFFIVLSFRKRAQPFPFPSAGQRRGARCGQRNRTPEVDGQALNSNMAAGVPCQCVKVSAVPRGRGEPAAIGDPRRLTLGKHGKIPANKHA